MSEILDKLLKEGEARGEARGRAEGEARGEARGRAEGFISVALNMIKEKLPLALIQKLTNLPLEKLQELSKECGVALVM